MNVLVVGAGPTGLLLAAELHRRGVRCRVIDAHRAQQHWDRATVVHPRSLEVFESLGLLERLLAAGVKQRLARLHAGGSVLGEIDLSLCGSRYGFNIGISEEITESILTDIVMGDEHEQLGPGQRLPDTIEACLASGESCRLHELTHRAGHTALLIGGASADADELARLERSLRAWSGTSLLEATLVLTAGSDDRHPRARLTPAAADQLGIRELTLLVIRPDGHVGLRADRDHLETLAAYHSLLTSGPI